MVIIWFSWLFFPLWKLRKCVFVAWYSGFHNQLKNCKFFNFAIFLSAKKLFRNSIPTFSFELTQPWPIRQIFLKTQNSSKRTFLRNNITFPVKLFARFLKFWILWKMRFLKLWILWKMRFWHCEFCQQWDFEIVNSVKNDHFKMWIFG